MPTKGTRRSHQQRLWSRTRSDLESNLTTFELHNFKGFSALFWMATKRDVRESESVDGVKYGDYPTRSGDCEPRETNSDNYVSTHSKWRAFWHDVDANETVSFPTRKPADRSTEYLVAPAQIDRIAIGAVARD
jgi:hypothetical protein